jgi:chemotaxis protein MotB
MPRRTRFKKLRSGANHERWLVSYADFITLLFAFFVVMFASTQTDRSRAKAVSDAVRRALSHESGEGLPKVSLILGGTVDNVGQGNAQMHGPGGQKMEAQKDLLPATELLSSLQLLRSDLAEEVQNGTVQLKLESRGLIIGLNTAAFFPSGDDTIAPASYHIVSKVASVLSKLPNALRLEGHTDSVPINTDRFHSNWELSAARSIAMLRLLNEEFGISRERMSIVGYADTESVDTNATDEGRKRNRRVDIVVVSEQAMRLEPEMKSEPRSPGDQ